MDDTTYIENLRQRVTELTTEVERLRAVLRGTHAAYCDEAYTSRGLHAPECLLYEVEP